MISYKIGLLIIYTFSRLIEDLGGDLLVPPSVSQVPEKHEIKTEEKSRDNKI